MIFELPFCSPVKWILESKGASSGPNRGDAGESLVVPVKSRYVQGPTTLTIHCVELAQRGEHLWTKFNNFAAICGLALACSANHEAFEEQCGYFFAPKRADGELTVHVAIPESHFRRLCEWLNNGNAELSALFISDHDYNGSDPQGEKVSLVCSADADYLAFAITDITFAMTIGPPAAP